MSDHGIAFQNGRSLQGMGAAMAFGLTAVSSSDEISITVKLYLLCGVLIIALFFYILLECQLQRRNVTIKTKWQSNRQSCQEMDQ